MEHIKLTPADYQRLIEKRNQHQGLPSLMGIRITEICDDYACAVMEITDYLKNTTDTIHGGAVFSLADTVGGAASWAGGYHVVTSNCSINYLNHTKGVNKLLGVGRIAKNGKRMVVVDVEIRDPDNRLIAKALITYVKLAAKLLDD